MNKPKQNKAIMIIVLFIIALIYMIAVNPITVVVFLMIVNMLTIMNAIKAIIFCLLSYFILGLILLAIDKKFLDGLR